MLKKTALLAGVGFPNKHNIEIASSEAIYNIKSKEERSCMIFIPVCGYGNRVIHIDINNQKETSQFFVDFMLEEEFYGKVGNVNDKTEALNLLRIYTRPQ